MVLTIIKNKRGRFDGLETKDKKAAADALSLKTDSAAVWVFDDDSLAIMTKMHQTLACALAHEALVDSVLLAPPLDIRSF